MHLTSVHNTEQYYKNLIQNTPRRSITIAVYNDKTFISSHTLRYSPQFLKKTDLGLYSAAPTLGGLFVEKGGYYATQIQIRGNTGHKVDKIGNQVIDGESSLKSVRELLLGSFGQGYKGDGNYIILSEGGTKIQVKRENIRVFLFDWLGETSYEVGNEEFYEIFPNNNQIFDYERQAGRMLWNFTINVIGKRINESEIIAEIMNDKINEELAYEKQFASTWEYLMTIKLGNRQAFTWFDRVNQYIAETYYSAARELYNIQNQVDLARIQGNAYVNIPYLTYLLFNDSIADLMDDLGITPNNYSASPTRGDLDWDLLKDSLKSFRQISRLVSYPERFRERKKLEQDYLIHYVKEDDTIRRLASIYNTDWKKIAKRNQLQYPYLLTGHTKLIIPIDKTSVTDNTTRTTLEEDGISTEELPERIFGRDIKVDKNGDWQLNKTTQDIETVSGPQNVIQSIECLEKTKQGEFPDYPFYGNPLLNYLGKSIKKAESAIMILQLKNVIAADPRISSVDQIELVSYKGVTSVNLTMTLINGVPLKNLTIPVG